MKKFKLKEEVYWVRGAKKSCLYDFNKNILYWLNLETGSVLSKILENFDIDIKNEDINEFLNNEIIEKAKTNTTIQDITTLFTKKRIIEFAWIEITNKCNLNCIHCYNDSDISKKDNLTINEFKYTVDELKKNNINTIQLIGGEPFLFPTSIIFEMFDYASQNFKEFEVFTNGTAVNEKLIKDISKRYSNIKFALSLHSFIPEEHDKITKVKNSYKKTTDTLRLLKKYNIRFRYVGIYIDESKLKIGEEQDFGTPYKRDYIRLTGRANLHLYSKKLLQKKLITKDSLIRKFNKEKVIEIFEESCFANYIYIGSNMNVYPCVMERRFIHGNLRNNSLSNILDKSILNISKEEVEECKDCEFRYICKDCRPDSLSDNIYAKPWYCTYNVYTGTWNNTDDYIEKLLNNGI